MFPQHELFDWLRGNKVGDLHVHSAFSFCCKEITFQDLVIKSDALHTPLTITDHSSHLILGSSRELIYRENISAEALSGLLKEFEQTGIQKYDEYIKVFRAQSSPLLRLGVELDALEGGLLFFPSHLLPEMELFIGHVPHLLAYKRNESLTAIMAEWRRRTEAMMIAGVDVIAHPLRVLCSKQIPFIVDETLRWLVEKAGMYSAVLEVNAHQQFPEVDEAMVKLAAAAGVKLALGTDSHHQRELFDFSYHSMILERCKVKADQFNDLLYHGQSKRKIDPRNCWCV
jgi:histidinol phosphatase-like PHP family hydrolase